MYNTPKTIIIAQTESHSWLPGLKAVVTQSGMMHAGAQLPLHHITQSIRLLRLLPCAPPPIYLPCFIPISTRLPKRHRRDEESSPGSIPHSSTAGLSDWPTDPCDNVPSLRYDGKGESSSSLSPAARTDWQAAKGFLKEQARKGKRGCSEVRNSG